MPGFTTPEQLFLAALVRYHRREIKEDTTRALPPRLHQVLRQCLLLFRLACIFCRTRDTSDVPEVLVKASEDQFILMLPANWMRSHPLTVHDLHAESIESKRIGIEMRLQAADIQ